MAILTGTSSQICFRLFLILLDVRHPHLQIKWTNSSTISTMTGTVKLPRKNSGRD